MAIGRRRLLGVLLTISLAVNLFAIGIFIGVVVVGGGPWPRGETFGPNLQASPAFMMLEPATRQMAIEMFQETEDQLREETRALRRAQRAVVRAMGAEPFDPAAARTALAELRARGDAVQSLLHNYLVDLGSNLSEDERERLSRMIFRGPSHRIPLAESHRPPHSPAG